MHGIMIYSLQAWPQTRSIGQKMPPALRAHQRGQNRVKYLAADCPTSWCQVDGVMLSVYVHAIPYIALYYFLAHNPKG
jgi:hypothetical protein